MTHEAAYRVLSYEFRPVTDVPEMGRYVKRILAPFVVDEPKDGARSGPAAVLYELEWDPTDSSTPYRLSCDGDWLIGREQPAPTLDYLFWHVNLQTIAHARDVVLVHAGAVEAPDGQGMILPGASGSGKTTLVAGLVRAGYGYLSDEAAVIDPTDLRLHPLPKALTVKKDGRDLLAPLRPSEEDVGFSEGRWHLHLTDAEQTSPVGACDIGLVIFPQYVPGAATELRSIDPVEVCLRLAKNAMNLRGRADLVLPVLARLSEATAGFELIGGDLDAAVAAVMANRAETDRGRHRHRMGDADRGNHEHSGVRGVPALGRRLCRVRRRSMCGPGRMWEHRPRLRLLPGRRRPLAMLLPRDPVLRRSDTLPRRTGRLPCGHDVRPFVLRRCRRIAGLPSAMRHHSGGCSSCAR